MNSFPTIGEYNQAIQKKGGSIFTTLSPIDIIPSRTAPIKVYLYGSGAYAAVFKGKKNGTFFALRCFLNAEKDVLTRYEAICSYLAQIPSPWKTSCEFLNEEVELNNSRYPVLKMDWVEGTLINEFVTNNLDDDNCLSDLQSKLVHVSRNLESHQIGHGDLQCGNIIISGSAKNFTIHLIDYDGMYVPTLRNRSSLEKGRSEFQHPRRTLNDFNPEMDRFSFWVMLTALEALKYDKTLWKEVMQGGFNTLDNFLFVVEDFLKPGKTELWRRLYDLKEPSLDYYLGKLESFCRSEVSQITTPQIYNSTIPPAEEGVVKNEKVWTYKPKRISSYESKKILIDSEKDTATVMTLSLVKIGTTPLELDRDLFKGRTLLITNGQQTQKLHLEEHKYKFLVEWAQNEKETLLKEDAPPIATTEKFPINNHPKPASTTKEVPAEPRTAAKSRSPWKAAAIFIAVLLISGFTGYHFDVFSSPKKVSIIEPDTTQLDHSTLKKLIKAEDQRDFNKIYAFYSPKVVRYWDESFPSRVDLKKKYEYAWSLSSHTSNDVMKIEKVGNREYNVHTNFTFYNKKRQDLKTIRSIVHFTLDQNGKVLETYGIDSKSSEKNDVKNVPSYGSTHYKNQIKGVLRAEERRNFQRVYNYFSPRMTRYWNINNPSKSQLHKTYSQLWDITSSSKNEIVKIEEIKKNIFHLHTNYSYYDLKRSENIAYYSVVRFQFGKDGKITKVYGISSERIYPETKVSSKKKRSETKFTQYSGDYIYFTFIDDKGIDVPLRKKPSVNSDALYTCPINAKVYILNTDNEVYYKVFVDGHFGYISKALL